MLEVVGLRDLEPATEGVGRLPCKPPATEDGTGSTGRGLVLRRRVDDELGTTMELRQGAATGCALAPTILPEPVGAAVEDGLAEELHTIGSLTGRHDTAG